MAIFLTGSTGYIGAHVASNLLADHSDSLNVLVRARDPQEARARLWHALQLHMDFPRFERLLGERIRIFQGDITNPHFGLSQEDYAALVRSTDSVIHCAASLNRKSEKSCLNVNLRGTLEVIQLARRARDEHGLRRFSHVSTVAVAGHRANEVVEEDNAIDWSRSDYDPYARTKKFCEHMVRELLPDVPRTIFRPSIVLGDSRKAETNQFDMVRAFVFLAGLPALPFRPSDRIDIVPVDYVANAIATLHQKEKPLHEIYHLSSGTGSETFQELTDALSRGQGKRGPTYLPSLEGPSSKMVDALAGREGKIGGLAKLLKVFLPYLVWNTVFDNARVVAEMGEQPARFSEYCLPLLQFSIKSRFAYPYREWPAEAGVEPASTGAAAMMDLVLEGWVAGLIELNKMEWIFGAGEPWKPGEKLKLLCAGYNGCRNTGSDVRVEEILRQLRRVLGAENISLSVMTQNFDLTRGYFGDARQVHLPDVFPPFLHRAVRESHGVVACEGSMFKSKFANALTTMMIGSLGIASAQNKLSIGYGAEAGAMDPVLQKMCRRYCRDSLVITRNVESQEVLGKLGIATELGTDTAWTFEPHPPEYGRKEAARCRMGRTDAGAGHLPDQSVLLAGERLAGQSHRALADRSARQELLPHDLFPPFGPGRGCGVRKISGRHGGRRPALPADATRCFRYLVAMEMLDSDACRQIAGAHRRRAVLFIRTSEHVRAGEHFARIELDAFLALPRHRHFHAGGSAFGGRDDGRAHSQPDARARARAFADAGGRRRSGGQDRGGARGARWRARRDSRGYGARGDAQPADHGAHGRLFRGARRAAISGVSRPHRRA